MFKTERVVRLLLHYGDHNMDTDFMRETDYFWLYNLYCEYNYIDKLKDERYLELIRKHPIYVLLMGSEVRDTRNDRKGRYARNGKKGRKGKEKNDRKNYLSILPVELYRLMLQY